MFLRSGKEKQISLKSSPKRKSLKRKLQKSPRPKSPATPTSFDNIYLNTKSPASYSSNVKAFVQQKRSISVHKRRIDNFSRRQIIVPGPYHSISCDLIDYSMYKVE